MFEDRLNTQNDTKAAFLYPASLKKLKYLVSLLFILPCFFLLAGNVRADFTDTFTAPDGTDLSTYNPIYTVTGNPVTIQNNAIAPIGSGILISGNNFVDGCMSMDWTGNSSNRQMSVRQTGVENYTFIEYDSTWQLVKNVPDTHFLAGGSMVFSGTHNYKLCAIGNTISVSKDGTQFTSAIDYDLIGSGGQSIYSEGGVMLDNLSITVNSATPNVRPITISPYQVQVNGSVSASANFSDPDTSDTHTAVWDWGDGNTTTGTVTESSGSGSVSDSHTYTTAGVHAVKLTVTNNIGQSGSYTKSVVAYNSLPFTFTDTFTAPDGTDLHTYNPIYTIPAVNPPVSIQNNSITPNGSEVDISGKEFSDGCMSMDWTGNSTHTEMDVRRNGLEDYAFFETDNNGDWALFKNDSVGTSTPLVGGTMSFSGTHTYKLCAIGNTISVSKDGTQFVSRTDSDITGVGGQAFYSDGNTLDNLSITVNATANAAPTINQIPNATKNEGDTYSYSGSFTDPDSSSWTATVDYGDGSGSHSLTLSGTNFSLSHVYQDNGSYTVTVSVTDNQGATGTGTATVTVNNVAPTPGAISVSTNPVQVNNATTASANFTDPGVLDTHTASWNWGDGNTTTGTVTENNGSGSVSDSHTYTTAGVYTITLTVTDKDGGVGTQTFQYVSVYNPTSQGLFSGGQHFSSPAGAYAQNTSLTGTVKFGLSYKYQGTMPVGDKQFTMNFNAANLLFNATTISSLVIANNKATLTGTGTINGSGTYNFLVVGINGGDIRIQITDPSNNNAVIYDTQPGDPATATPTTSVTGNVIAHN